MLPKNSNIGLKEWAVTSDVLGRGDQILMLRKGGIREDGRHFKIEHETFLLYPGLYHELFNEVDKLAVFNDMYDWLGKRS